MRVSCCEMCALEGKLSKFIFPASVPLSSTRRQLRKMVTSGEHKSFCVLDLHVNKSVVSGQRHFWTEFGTDPLIGKSVQKWYLQFQDRLYVQTKIDWTSVDSGRSSGACPHKLRKEPSATSFPRFHPVWFLLVGFHQGSCFHTTTSSNAGWPAHAQHSSHHSDWPRHATKSLAVLWVEHILNICNVPEFSFPWILIMSTYVILNSSNKLSNLGKSFWLCPVHTSMRAHVLMVQNCWVRML
jgi:hypothetical protein